jgi:hypothetical protein
MAMRKKSPPRRKRLARAASRPRRTVRTVRRIVVRRIRKAKRGLPPSVQKSPLQVEATQRLVEQTVPHHSQEASPEHVDRRSRFWAPAAAWMFVFGVAGIALLAAGLPSSTRPDSSRDDSVRQLETDFQLPATVPSKQTQAAPRTAPVKTTQSTEAIEARETDT